MNLTTPQKVFLGVSAVVAYLFYKSSTAQAATNPAASLPAASGGGTPNAGDGLMVVTQDTGAAGRLNVRTNPGTNYPEVALIDHGSTVTATGQVQTASDGSTWYQVKTGTGITGWAESNYLQDIGPMTTVSSSATAPQTTV